MLKKAILSLSLFIVIAVTAQKINEGFKFITPTMGMKSLPMWIKGDKVQIKWTGGKPTDHVGLALIIKDHFVVHSVIADDVDNTGNYNWIIPTNSQDGVYEIYIHHLDTPSLFWYSGDFVLETRGYAQ